MNEIKPEKSKMSSSGNEGVSPFKIPENKGYINITIAVPNTEYNRALLRQIQEIANRDFFNPQKHKGSRNRLTIRAWSDFRDQHYKGNPQTLLDVRPEKSETTKGREKWRKCDKRMMMNSECYCTSPKYAGSRGRIVKVGPDFIKCARCTKKHGK